MRIFDEKTGDEIENPDLTKGIIKEQTQTIYINYELTKPENIVYDTHTLDNGSKIKIKNEQLSEPAEGKWHFSDNKGIFKTIEDTGEDWSKTEPTEDTEHIGIYHKWTAEEILDRNRKEQERQEKDIKAALDQQNIDELPQFESDTDGAVCELYELMLPVYENLNIKLKDDTYSKIAWAYARRIMRGEITLDDVPPSIRDEVREILEKN